MSAYQAATRHLRRPIGADPDMLEFVRFASLTANGHNTQPWRFRVGASGASILPDLSRRTEVVDPDDHHLHVSLGCAAENFVLAAAAHGRPAGIAYDPDGEGRIDIDLATGPARGDPLYRAIPERQSTRSDYDGRKVATNDFRRLEAAAVMEGVNVSLFTSSDDIDKVLDFVVAGNTLQMDDPHFVRELKRWIRFNAREVLRTGDGLFAACSGNPTAPTWLGKIMFGLAFRKDAENDKYRRQLRSSAGIAVFTAAKADGEHWIRVGRSFQRFALQATALGIRHAHVNQPVEVPSVRSDFASWLGAPDSRPDLVIRFGYAPPLPMSLRRSASAIVTGP